MYQKEHREYLLELFSYKHCRFVSLSDSLFFEDIAIAVNRAYDMDGEKRGINKKDVTQLFIISTRWNMWNELHHPRRINFFKILSSCIHEIFCRYDPFHAFVFNSRTFALIIFIFSFSKLKRIVSLIQSK